MNNGNNIFMIAIVVAVSFFVGIIFFAGSKNKEPQTVELPLLVQEYSDFECPACKDAVSVVEQIKGTFGDDILFEFKHFPLTSIHEYSYDAALSAEAARKQSKFQEYHDILFENQPNFSTEELEGYAEELGLDLEKFRTDRDSEEVKNIVDTDLAAAMALGLNGTPSFVVDGEPFSLTGRTYDDLINYIDDIIKNSKEAGGNAE